MTVTSMSLGSDHFSVPFINMRSIRANADLRIIRFTSSSRQWRSQSPKQSERQL